MGIQRKILGEFYDSTNGNGWTSNDNWKKWNEELSEWYGLEVYPGGKKKVKKMNLALNGVMGSLPVSIGDLSSLKVLNITGNDIGGPLPTHLGQLRKLRVLTATANKFEGSIPT